MSGWQNGTSGNAGQMGAGGRRAGRDGTSGCAGGGGGTRNGDELCESFAFAGRDGLLPKASAGTMGVPTCDGCGWKLDDAVCSGMAGVGVGVGVCTGGAPKAPAEAEAEAEAAFSANGEGALVGRVGVSADSSGAGRPTPVEAMIGTRGTRTSLLGARIAAGGGCGKLRASNGKSSD